MERRRGDLLHPDGGGREDRRPAAPPKARREVTFARNGRSDLRCGEISGSPPRPGTSVNSVATIGTPRSRATKPWGATVRQHRDRRIPLTGAAIGPIQSKKSFSRSPRTSARSPDTPGPLHDRIADGVDPARLPRLDHCGHIGLLEKSPAQKSVAPAGRWSRAETSVSRPPPSNQTRRKGGELPATPPIQARTPKSRKPGGGRSPRRAARRCASRGPKARGPRPPDGGLEGLTDHGLASG